MITNLQIEHFKSIEKLEIDLGRLVMFVGPNATGKSNIVDALRFIKDAVNYDLDRAISDRHGIDSIRQWSPSKPYHVTITIGIQERFGEGEFSLTLASSKGQYRIIREAARWSELVYTTHTTEDEDGDEVEYDVEEQVTSSYVRDRDGRVDHIQKRGDRPSRHRQFKFEQYDDLLISSFPRSRISMRSGLLSFNSLRRALNDFEAYSIFPNTLRTPQTPSNDQRLSSDGSNLTSIFKLMTRTKAGNEARSEIISSLGQMMSNLDNITIQSLGGLMVPAFRVREAAGKKHDFNVSQISDGTLRILGLLTALYQPHKPDSIALEEPEQTVNPGVLGVLADAIKDVASDSQVIVTTHSPNLIDYFEPEEIYAVNMSEGLTTVGSIIASQTEAVKQQLFTLGELMTIEGLAGE